MASMASCYLCYKCTKYSCIACKISVCNICCSPEMDEETPRWTSGSSVGYCGNCSLFTEEGSESVDQQVNKRNMHVESRMVANPRAQDLENESSEDETEDEENIEVFRSRVGKRKSKDDKLRKRAGRRSKWPECLLNDMINIITSNEYFKQKLIFTYNRYQKNSEICESVLNEMKKCAAERHESVEFTAIQIRNKFKKAVSECKRAAMLMKSASGIKRFQEERGYGQWFDQLFALVKTRDSCQPDQAIEPTASAQTSSCVNSPAEATSDSQEFFVPTHAKRRKTKRENQFGELMSIMKSIVDNNPMNEFLEFAREEAEKSRQHEMRMMQLLLQSKTQPQQQQQFYPNPSPDFNYSITTDIHDNANSTSYYNF